MADAGRKRQRFVACERRAHGRDWTSLPSDITNVIAERLLAEDVVDYMSFRAARRLRFRLPELHGHRIVGFTDGLLILLNKGTTVVRVLHPFTRAFLDLPPLAPIFHLLVKDTWSRAWMDAAVCWSYASIAVVAWFPNVPVVVYTKPTHARWLVIH
uniref:KIB1-4 beta-propeller domain-containing protein n=1 Tax=Setaria viridis TaxID=4556 RepID=A0A4U6VWT7_SETVI|nr:hypothetical protein SEVIR_2G308900v2 [Setaria viridis]